MKKCLFMIALAFVAICTLNSCKPDEEIYDPTCKISKIWYRSDVGDPSEVYNYDEKNALTSITIDSTGSFDFTYNKDKTVSQIVHKGEYYTEKIDITYTDRLVNKMVYTVNDTIRQEIEFTRDEETQRIKNMNITYDKAFFDQYAILNKCSLYNRYVGNIKEVHNMMKNASTKALTVRCKTTITYAEGDKKKFNNIDNVIEEYPDLQQVITRTYTYDEETYNPFYSLQYAYAGYAGYYLNNKKTETMVVKTAGVVTRQINIKYSYEGTHYMNDKNYPRQFITTSSENNVPIHTYILYVK